MDEESLMRLSTKCVVHYDVNFSARRAKNVDIINFNYKMSRLPASLVPSSYTLGNLNFNKVRINSEISSVICFYLHIPFGVLRSSPMEFSSFLFFSLRFYY